MLLSSCPAGAGPRCEAPARLRSLQSQGQRVYEPLRALLLCQLWEDASQRRHCAEKVSASIFAPSHNSGSSNTQLSVQMLRDCPFFFLTPESLLPFTYLTCWVRELKKHFLALRNCYSLELHQGDVASESSGFCWFHPLISQLCGLHWHKHE